MTLFISYRLWNILDFLFLDSGCITCGLLVVYLFNFRDNYRQSQIEIKKIINHDIRSCSRVEDGR